MVLPRGASLLLLLGLVACGSSPGSPSAPVTTSAAYDCTVLARQLASIPEALDKPPTEGGSPRRVFEDAERDLRAAAPTAGSTRDVATGYADLLRDFVALIDRAKAQLADLTKQSEGRHATTRPAVAALKMRCPRAAEDEDTTSDCGRVRAVLDATSRLEPDCVRCIEQLADRLEALGVQDAEIARLKPEVVQAIRHQATNEAAFSAARATGKRELDGLMAREAELRRRGRAACPTVEIAPIFQEPSKSEP